MLYGKRRQLARAGCAAQQALARQAASTERRFSLLACAPAGVMTLVMYSARPFRTGRNVRRVWRTTSTICPQCRQIHKSSGVDIL